MAKSAAVWGIDIGNSSLKALRCRTSETLGKIEALAFDYIEHSKILTQPGAEPAEILAETIQTFLARNSTKGDKVAISVSGQSTISRFLKLPPVDPKKIPDIIRYEAKQWLPFDLDDVIWTYQPIGAPGQGDTMMSMDAEVGMFAMKRDVAARTLAPYLESNVNVDCIQSSPLAVYNFAAFDQLAVHEVEEYDPDNPPELMVLLCIGTDATDVVFTNGFSIWLRSIPIGGSAFTKALTKSLKLTFSKAEYLKRNAAAAPDPKAVFQAMRPVFNDILSEVHRSLEYYQGLNRRAKFSKILALGNAMKLPGLRQFLTQNLGYDVARLSKFARLEGAEVIDAPLFKENIHSFGVSYGLALQLLGEAPLMTNLVPQEIITERIVREKKPWILATAASVLLGLTLQFSGASRALEIVSRGEYGAAESQAKTVQDYSGRMKSETSSAVGEFEAINNVGKNLTSNVEGRITWLELLRAINAALPIETERLEGQKASDVAKQDRLFVSNIEAVASDNLAAWFAPLKMYKKYYPDDEEVRAAMANSTEGGAEGSTSGSSMMAPQAPVATTEGGDEGDEVVAGTEGTSPAGPSAPTIPQSSDTRLELIPGPPEGVEGGRVVQLSGYHYHNAETGRGAGADSFGSGYVRKTIINNLKYGSIVLPSTLEKQSKGVQTAKDTVTMKELGISYPTLLHIPKAIETDIINPRVLLEIFLEDRRKLLERQGGGFGGGGFGSGGEMSGGFGGRSRGGDSGMAQFGGMMSNPFQSSGSLDMGNIGTGRGGKSAIDYIKEISSRIDEKDKIRLRRFDFVVQFAWVETPPSVRAKKKEEERLAALATQQDSPSNTDVDTDATDADMNTPAAPENDPTVSEQPTTEEQP